MGLGGYIRSGVFWVRQKTRGLLICLLLTLSLFFVRLLSHITIDHLLDFSRMDHIHIILIFFSTKKIAGCRASSARHPRTVSRRLLFFSLLFLCFVHLLVPWFVIGLPASHNGGEGFACTKWLGAEWIFAWNLLLSLAFSSSPGSCCRVTPEWSHRDASASDFTNPDGSTSLRTESGS